jgi:hypothetical protein
VKRAKLTIPELKKVESDAIVLSEYENGKPYPAVDPLEKAKVQASGIIANLKAVEKENVRNSPEKQRTVTQKSTVRQKK